MIPADLDRAVVAAVRAATAGGELTGAVPEDAGLRWQDGAFVTPLPMRLAAADGARPGPRRVAELIARRLGRNATVIGPGFLRIEMELDALARYIVETGDGYGAGEPIEVEPEPEPESESEPEPMAGRPWPDRPRTFDNPGFRVRFAHARAAAVRRQATQLGIGAGAPEGLLGTGEERTLLGRLAELPARAPAKDAPGYRRRLVRVADAYHDVHERCPALPKGDEAPGRLHEARLTLAEAVRIALNNGLRTLGETPEERL